MFQIRRVTATVECEYSWRSPELECFALVFAQKRMTPPAGICHAENGKFYFLGWHGNQNIG